MRKGKKIKISKQDRIYLFLVYLFLGIFILCVLYPLLYVVSCSFSDPEALVQGRNSNRCGSFHHSILCALEKRISVTQVFKWLLYVYDVFWWRNYTNISLVEIIRNVKYHLGYRTSWSSQRMAGNGGADISSVFYTGRTF